MAVPRKVKEKGNQKGRSAFGQRFRHKHLPKGL